MKSSWLSGVAVVFLAASPLGAIPVEIIPHIAMPVHVAEPIVEPHISAPVEVEEPVARGSRPVADSEEPAVRSSEDDDDYPTPSHVYHPQYSGDDDQGSLVADSDGDDNAEDPDASGDPGVTEDLGNLGVEQPLAASGDNPALNSQAPEAGNFRARPNAWEILAIITAILAGVFIVWKIVHQDDE